MTEPPDHRVANHDPELRDCFSTNPWCWTIIIAAALDERLEPPYMPDTIQFSLISTMGIEPCMYYLTLKHYETQNKADYVFVVKVFNSS